MTGRRALGDLRAALPPSLRLGGPGAGPLLSHNCAGHRMRGAAMAAVSQANGMVRRLCLTQQCTDTARPKQRQLRTV